MMRKFTSFREINAEMLMEVYAESICKQSRRFRDASPERKRMLAEAEFCDYLRENFFSERMAACYIWSEDGEYRSAVRAERYEDGWLISGLETHPEHRGEGYASELLRAVLADLQGTAVYSHIKKDNYASLHLHLKCGFVQNLDYGVMLDGSVNSQYKTFLFPVNK